jgi:mercuric reductase
MKGPEANPEKAEISPEKDVMSTYTLWITGMTCDHCARTAEEALQALPDVKALVSYEEGIARVTAPQDLGIERVIERIEAKGFKASLREEDASPEPTRSQLK